MVIKSESVSSAPKDQAIQQEGPQQVIVLNRDPIGSSGTQNYSGYIYEEYLSTMQGITRADTFDKMRRSDDQIKMVVSAVKNPIKKATWEIHPAGDDPEQQLHAEFIEHVLFNDMDKPWRRFLNEALSMVIFGCAPFEVTHKVVLDHPKFGSYNGIRSLGWRSPRTIDRWNVDKVTGKLISISQQAQGDLQRFVDIPAEFLLLFTLDQEGDNYEGISLLRSCYGAYMRKQVYLKMEAIGVEKFAVPTPILKVPKNKENSEEFAMAKEALEIYTSHQSNYMTLPEGWEIDFPESTFDPEKLGAAIERCDKAIAKNFLAGFLELGISSNSGSYSLSFDQSDFFLGGIEHIADEIKEGINLQIIPQLIQMKFGPQENYPQLCYSGISDRAGQELSVVLKNLADGRIVEPDDQLEENVRKRYRLPKKSLDGRRTPGQPAPQGPGMKPAESAVAPDEPMMDPEEAEDEQADPQAEEQEGAIKTKLDKLYERRPDLKGKELSERIVLAEKNARKQIGEGKAQLKAIMKGGIQSLADSLISKVMANLKGLSDAQRIKAIKDIEPSGVGAYKKALLEALAVVAADSLKKARMEVPAKAKLKLAGSPDSIQLGEFDNLPPSVKKKVQAQAELLVGTQLADLEKAVYFQFTSSVDSTDSDSLLEKDMKEAAADYIDGASVEAASGNSVASIVNSARNAFFFEDEVLKEIDSFTFVNGDPVSPICQDLAGTTFAKDDPEAQRYFPPLHHNCKSYLVPNLVGGTKRDIGELKPSSPTLEKFITLSDADCCGSDRGV